MKKIKCKVCGARFAPLASERYKVVKRKGLITEIAEGSEVLECFDCPRCGCQVVVGQRADRIYKNSEEAE